MPLILFGHTLISKQAGFAKSPFDWVFHKFSKITLQAKKIHGSVMRGRHCAILISFYREKYSLALSLDLAMVGTNVASKKGGRNDGKISFIGTWIT